MKDLRKHPNVSSMCGVMHKVFKWHHASCIQLAGASFLACMHMCVKPQKRVRRMFIVLKL